VHGEELADEISIRTHLRVKAHLDRLPVARGPGAHRLVEEEGNALLEGPQKLIGVMVKDPERYGETDGWGYYAFGPDKKPLAIDPKACHACHQGAANTDYVFSAFRP